MITFIGEKRRINGLSTIPTILIVLLVLLASIGVYFLIQNFRSTPTRSPYITEFNVINRYSTPQAITVDSQGNVWFILLNESDLGVLYSSNSTIGTFHIPVPTSYSFQSWGIAVDNARHLVWFGDDMDNSIWSFNIQTDQFKSYDLNSSFPQQIVVDPNGNVWFAEFTAKGIGEITTTDQILHYSFPTKLASVPYSGPVGLTRERNGTFWFTEPNADTIGSLTVSGINNHVFNYYNLTGEITEPVGIAVDSHGNLWIDEHGPSLIAEFNPATGYLKSISTHIPTYSPYSLPYFVYIDSKGNIWFNEHEGNAIARFSPSNNSLVEYLIPTRVASQDIAGAITMTLSSNGTPWFTEWFAGKIGRVNLEAPINVGLSFQNSLIANGTPLSLSSTQSINLSLNINSSRSSNLEVFLSNPDLRNTTAGFSYRFLPTDSKGDFTSQLTIQDQGLASGTYFFTVSVLTSELIVSRVIQVYAS